jgi:hypothetical protein
MGARLMAISVSRIIYQTEIILREHAFCEQKCLGERKLDLEQHTKYVAHLIAYYALGEDK